MTIEEASGPAVEIWPDNLQSVNLFIAMSTQWRVGMNGPIGLDYNVLYRMMDRLHLSEDSYDELESEIRVMEGVALETMREAKK